MKKIVTWFACLAVLCLNVVLMMKGINLQDNLVICGVIFLLLLEVIEKIENWRKSRSNKKVLQRIRMMAESNQGMVLLPSDDYDLGTSCERDVEKLSLRHLRNDVLMYYLLTYWEGFRPEILYRKEGYTFFVRKV